MADRSDDDHSPGQPDRPSRAPYRARIPGFVLEEEVGLGDVIKRATTALGIRPCGGCRRRAEALNRRITFRPRGSR